MRRANRLAIKPLVLLGTLLFAAALLGGQPVQGQTAAELDRAALVALYDSTDGANWTNSTNWKIDDDLGTWYGVLVTSDGRVTDLNLANNNLVGTLPDELGNLTSLRALTLNENQLTGKIPDLSASLVYVYLGDNLLTGAIPALSGLTRLQLLSLEQNQLTGEIPDLSATLAYVYLSDNLLTGEIPDLSSLTGLTYLYLNQNQLTGEIPASLGGLTGLTNLYLNQNQLTGEIPASLGGLTGLTNLYLWGNQLTGEIPASLGGLTGLTNLYLWGNQLTGEIPASLGGLTNLQQLYLNGNQLTGEIPASLGGLTNLLQLALWGNQLTGEIPDLSGLTRLQLLYLNGNQLTGEIPDLSATLAYVYLSDNLLTGGIPDLSSLTGLAWLYLNQNQLTGEIPASLGGLTGLTNLYLWGNQLTGEIPDLSGLTGLTNLYLNQNQLTGEIPASLGGLTNLAVLYLWGNELTGEIPDLSGLTRLQQLTLSHNQLTGKIPESLGSLTALTELSLNQNQLTGEIPASLGSLTSLQKLYLWGNKLTGAIPGSLGSLTDLQVLYLQRNRLTGAIPGSLGSLTAMQDLTLSQNQLTGAIPDLSSLTSLGYLYLNQNQLTGEIPAWLGNLTGLYQLSLWGNQLTGEIPDSLDSLTSLRILNLNNNLLTGAVPNFSSLNLLGRTRFANNALTGCVPHVWRALVADEGGSGVPGQDFIAVDANDDGDTDDEGDVPGVNLPFCMLSALTLSGLDLDPAFAFGTMTYTVATTAASTTVTATRYESTDRLSVRKGATSYSVGDAIPLDVGSNLITIEVTPTDSRLLKQTYTVDVFRAGSAVSDRAALIALYNSAGGSGWTASDGWDSARTLDTWHGVTVTGGRVVGLALAGNNLSGTVPASLSTLTKLTSLDLSYNGLSGAIPPGLRGLSQLTTLDLSANGLSGAIPPELGDLSSLDELYLHDNALSGAIPPELGNLSSLEELYLHDNALSGAIPPELGNLSSLEELSLWDNGLSGPIPGSLGNLLALRFARFADNLLTGCVPHGLRYLVAAGEFVSGVPAHDFTRDANGDGDTTDLGDITGLALPFCALSQLTLGSLTLDPAFDDGTVAYIASAGHSVTSTTVTATLNNSADGVSITKGTDTYTSGDTVPLAVGVNVITIAVTASDGTTAPHTYSVAVARAPNMPPVFDEGPTATRGVDENTAANQPIGNPLTATDADNDTLTYSLDTTSDAFFDIDSGGQLLTEAGLDYEARSSYPVNVSVSDGKASDGTASDGTDSTITVTITVENVDEPPLIVGETSIEFAENGTGTVDTYSASDPEGAAVTWLLPAGRDGSAFALSASGALTFNAPPNHETQDVYEVILGASSEGEKGMQTGTLDVTVTVTNVDEPADISFAASGGVTVTDNALSVDENYDGTLATFSASDPEGEAGLTYEWSVGGTDRLDFAVTGGGGVLSFAAIPDYELPADSGGNNVYDITVQATEVDDGDPLTLELTGRLDVTVTITNENERPVVRRSSGTGPFSIVENSGTDVGRFVATDPEGQGVTWSLETTGDHGRFEIDAANGALSFKEAPDYESSDLGLGPDKAYTVTVQATEVDDGEPLTLERTGRLAVTVTITNVNEPPTVTGNATPSVDENTTAVATYSATDPEGVTVTWSLQGGGGVFMITSAGALAFTTAPNYEVKFSYTVTVRASDGVSTTDHPVTVTVTDVDEDEELKFSASQPLIGADYTAAFEDGTGDAVQSPMWAWERSPNGTSSWDDITGATAATYRPVGADRDHYLRVTVSYNDGHGQGRKTLQATSELPTLPDISTNMPPVFPSPLFAGGATGLSVPENATAGTVVGVAPQAIDPEDGTLSYSLAVTGFTTDPPFEINATSRQIQVAGGAVLDHEDQDSYSVTVTAKDEYTATGTATFDITIEDVNERPVVKRRSGMGAFSIVENSGTDVGRFVATDPEGQGVTWSLETSGDHGRFEIDEANGALSFKEAPDYESSDLGLGPDKAYTVTVQATEQDDGEPLTLELTGDLDVTVTITNVNEPPVVRRSSGTGAFSIEENSGRDVGSFDATDPEGRGVTWSVAGSDSGRFEIDEANGALSFKELPDFESDDIGLDKAYTVTVRATEVDDGDTQTLELTGRLDVTVAITNVNEPPTVTGNATPSVDENTTAVATYSATDPEEVPPSWSLQGGGGVFMITSAGALAFTTAPNYEVKFSYTVTVLASDGVNTTNHPVTVTVTDVDEDEELLLSARRPLIGADYTAAFEVGKGDAVQSPMWVWARSMSLSGPWADITVAATAATYVPVGADRDHYLRVTVSYHDGHAPRTLQATSELPTLPDIPNNMPPVFPSPLFAGGATGLSVDENATAGTVVGLAPQATDPESGSLSYSLAVSGVVTPPFEINDTSRQIRVASGAVLDHEDQDRYSVTVTAEDEYNATGTATFDITIEDVNERPVAVFDIPPATNEDTATTFAVLGNDIDQDDGDTLTVSITSQPSRGLVVADTTTQLVTYTPAENDHGTYTFMYTASDGTLSSLPALVTVTVDPVNDAPAFPAAPAERTVSENARPGDDVGAALTATDVDGDTLTYGLTGAAASDFEIDEQTGQITVATGAALNAALSPYIVTVTADDGSGEANATATVEVTITVTARPVVIITGGGGGGGGGGGPSPSEVDFEWNVTRDIAELDGGNDRATGVWSDGTTLWVADNADGAGDAVYAYDLASGERVEEREFDLAEANRAPRGIWSDRSVVWVSDSGQERLFAYDLATGERVEEREFALAERNSDARGIWSDEETMWVLDSRAGALFAYDFETGELLAEYELDAANDDPRGIWSDGVTIWVADHGAKRLFAYRLPVLLDAETDSGEEDADDDARELERVSDEEFTELSKASNNSPRGIWSDGEVMYVADESDDRVYSYNMPDAIDARLASLTLSGVDIGEFDPGRPEYEGAVGEGVTETVVTAEAMQRRTTIAIDPQDADVEADGHQVALQDLGEITVTVTSQDGSRTRVYRVQFPDTGWDPARDPWPHCLRGAISEGFSLVVHEGGSVEELIGCAESRGIVALYALHEGVYVSHILGAPDFVNAGFVELFPDGLPPIAPLIAGSNGPPSADPFADLDDGGQQPWPECLRGDIAAGFSLVVHEGGSVDELEACAQSRDVAALYALSDGEFVSYILGAPDFVTRAFRDLFADGVPPMTPLVARSEGPPGGR